MQQDPQRRSDGRVAIGMFRATDPTGATVLACAHAALMQGADLFSFTPADVDVSTRTIRAFARDSHTWKQVTVPFPDVIDNDDKVTSSPVWPLLTAGRPFSMNSLGGKAEAERRIRSDGLFPDILIPSLAIESPRDVVDAIERFGPTVVKPARGAKGDKVHLLRRAGAGFAIDLRGDLTEVAEPDFPAFCAKSFGQGDWIAQRYIDARTGAGLPFDIRIHVRRDHRAAWQTVKIYTRIGSGLGITSNLATGGSVAAGRAFLRMRFGDKGDEIWQGLRDLAREMPRRIQDLYPEFMIDALGFDLGIDAEGKPWLFEVNSYPGARHFALEAAIPRMGYAIHLALRHRRQNADGASVEKSDKRPSSAGP